MNENNPSEKQKKDFLAAMTNSPDAETPNQQEATTKTDRLEELKKRKAQLEQKIKNEERKITAQKRKDDTRLKILIGAAFVADTIKHPETKDLIKAVLHRGIQREKERELLKKLGWL